MRLTLATVIAFSASLASAGDFCFNSTSPPNPAPPTNPDILVVAQNFKVPGKGKCKAVVGFEVASATNEVPPHLQTTRAVSGTACLSATGDLLRLGLTLHEVYDSRINNSSAVYPELSIAMDIPYPSLTNGQVQFRQPTDAFGSVRQDVFAAPCKYPLFF
jgi:hypothetical protein